MHRQYALLLLYPSVRDKFSEASIHTSTDITPFMKHTYNSTVLMIKQFMG